MPKKPARNAFWYFMSDWKTREESQGREFPNGFSDVQRDSGCNDAWQALTPDQRAQYTKRAKQGKQVKPLKLTGTNECVETIKLEEEREQDFKLNMNAHIRHIVFEAKKDNAVPSLNFLFLHMNIYYMREPDNEPVDFCPAELAIAEFSLADGITRYYHEIIKTQIHLGYTREAAETSENSHKLRWNLPIGEGDWRVIYNKMLNFVKPNMVNGKFPPIYTAKRIHHMLPSLQRRLTAAVPEHKADPFLFYHVEALFSNVLRAVNEFADSNILGAIAETQFSKEHFAFTPNIECEHHSILDGTSQFCSLSIVRQWAFTFCEVCNHPLGLPMVPGIHCPETNDTIMNGSKMMNSSIRSSLSEYTPSVLSATGVSEQHRLAVSERNREEERRRRNALASVEIIDHSKLTKDEKPPEPVRVQPIAVASVPHPLRRLRVPTTANQALVGVTRDVPVFDKTNFPIIGGRGVPMKSEETTRRPGPPIWNHRSHIKSSDDDSD